jgi:hypothetical protein
VFTLDDLASGVKKVQNADRIISIKQKKFTAFNGIKKGEINVFHGSSRGAGKSLAAQRWIDKHTDKRISAISRDGNIIEINYHSYDADKIPGFLDWIAEVGVGDYTLEGQYIIFADTIDADLFWMTFVGIKANRFFQMKKTEFSDMQDEFKVAQAFAKDTGQPLIVRQQTGDHAYVAINAQRSASKT